MLVYAPLRWCASVLVHWCGRLQSRAGSRVDGCDGVASDFGSTELNVCCRCGRRQIASVFRGIVAVGDPRDRAARYGRNRPDLGGDRARAHGIKAISATPHRASCL